MSESQKTMKLLPNSILKSLFFILILFPTSLISANPLKNFESLRQNPQLQRELQSMVASTLNQFLGKAAPEPKLSEFFQSPQALFVTLIDAKNETRGCMGSLTPQRANLAEEIRHKIILALTQDPWHSRIPTREIQQLRVYITAIGASERVDSVREISPAFDGIFLKSGTKGAVLLPGEAKTQRYLLAKLKAKAGLKKNEAFDLYRLKTATIEVKDFWP